MRSAVCVIALGVLLSRVYGFVPVGGGGNTHVTITGDAVMKKIHEVCKAVAESEGREFKPTGSSAEELLRACLGTATGEVSAAKFREALNQIYMQNSMVDRDFMASDRHHFNSETFNEGRALITQGMTAIKANIRSGNFQAARETLGRALHTLQDFYSHSNWVELGNKKPYPNLIRPDLTISNIADVNTPTCSDCASGTCSNPLLPAILNEKKLTSGYMGLFSNNKPQGKCSHGGDADLSSTQNPRGGINKDERKPHNADFHNTAVAIATEATLQLLEDIRGAAGNKDYLRLMGIARSAVLCFVIDTTGSMADDIAEAKRVAHNIIDSKKGTQDEPSEYILVPFNDPKFGPLIRTTNPDVMKAEIAKLDASGGGDIPEMCLSGLQLALTGAPASSQIYVFTDAPAKDTHLEKTIIALIRSTKSTVSFFMTPTKRSTRSVSSEPRSVFQLYYDLALASGGQAIQVSKAELPSATDIIVDTSTSALVTILQRARNPGRVEIFPFLLDASVSNITAYITGDSLRFTLKSPSGVSQSHTVSNGPLAVIQTVGNLRRVHFTSPIETGLWNISVESTASYTIKVMGQSPNTFIYNFVEEFKGPHPGFAVIEGRPQTGLPAKLLLTVTGQKGADSLKVQEVALVEVSGSRVSDGKIQEMGGGDFLVTVSEVPAGEFVVMMKGEEKASSSRFQRQSTTQMSLAKVTIKATVDSTLLPGIAFKLPFTLTTSGTSGTYTITARNDRDYPLNYPSNVNVVSGVSAESSVTLTPPANTASGTDITLTIAAEGPGGDSNYAVVRLSVVAKVTDFTPPVCEIVGVSGICPSDCTQSNWDMAVNITDGNGTGIQSISIQEGRGNFTQKSLVEGGITVVMGNYSASCCSPDVTISIVDKEGNVGKCSYSVEKSGGVSLSLSLSLWACLLLSTLNTLWDVLPLS
ncbi:von Willebrand factor A domain-containing protein 7 [Astyanax mexicanus]|uniref:von Willebrand factor A domain-containing protein 7 n=1 Tax=Astyanax mexicanus TaxID=7994 RepID=UPI000BBDE491|nr:von Willebrand factor A domain-containing protein 7 [Astyanax mexicanus]